MRILGTRQEYSKDGTPVDYVMCKNQHDKSNNHFVNGCPFTFLGSSLSDRGQKYFITFVQFVSQIYVTGTQEMDKGSNRVPREQFRFVRSFYTLYVFVILMILR